MFDDSRLDRLAPQGAVAQRLWAAAMTGAWIRQIDHLDRSNLVSDLDRPDTLHPRAIVLVGAADGLLTTLIGIGATVPVVSVNGSSLPTWLGPLDLVILAGSAPDDWEVTERVGRRGSWVLSGAGLKQLITMSNQGPVELLEAVAIVACLTDLGLCRSSPLTVWADRLDDLASRCGPARSIETNQAKSLAGFLAELPLVLVGDDPTTQVIGGHWRDRLMAVVDPPVMLASTPMAMAWISRFEQVGPFHDPFEDQSHRQRPVLVRFQSGSRDAAISEHQFLSSTIKAGSLGDLPPSGALASLCQSRHIDYIELTADWSDPLGACLELWVHADYVASYLLAGSENGSGEADDDF
jgi:hypothetical protein